ncbi:MAG: TIM barrel protein [Caldilineaceae bacterium]|nr:TIM barrel protein [Caldilineaceae bacterium]
MQFGCCCSLDQAEMARGAGFDFVECTVRSLLPEVEEFAPILAAYGSSPLPVRAFNVFLPGDLKITGPAVDWPAAQRYVDEALRRVHTIGAWLVVFGSGGARNVPDGFDRVEADAQLVRFLQIVAAVAEPLGVTVVIEPLNRLESNVINDVPAGVRLAQQVDSPSIQVLADLYHMQMDGEPLENVEIHRSWIRHIHVADSGRFAPGTGEYPYAEFFRMLHRIGYDGMISVECKWRDFEAEAPAAVRFLREMWREAQA